jgi:methylmalonyl-CoA mutase, N-terminal domain
MSATPTKEAPNKPRAVSEPVRRVVNESGIEVKPLYTTEDVAASGVPDTSRPGEPPFTRGIHPLMYRHRPWTMRQYTGLSLPGLSS